MEGEDYNKTNVQLLMSFFSCYETTWKLKEKLEVSLCDNQQGCFFYVYLSIQFLCFVSITSQMFKENY